MWRFSILLILAASLARAQLLFSEIEAEEIRQPKRPLIADVTATITSDTPWGVTTHTETGKYWRSSQGQIRQDDQHGLSMVVNLRGKRTLTHIDYESKTVDQEVFAGRSGGTYTGLDVSFANPLSLRYKKAGETVIDGVRVTIRRGQLNDRGVRGDYEIWSSDDLKLIVYFKLTVPGTTFEQRYHNLRVEEPDATVFALPEGFRTSTLTLGIMGRDCVRGDFKTVTLDMPSSLLCQAK